MDGQILQNQKWNNWRRYKQTSWEHCWTWGKQLHTIGLTKQEKNKYMAYQGENRLPDDDDQRLAKLVIQQQMKYSMPSICIYTPRWDK